MSTLFKTTGIVLNINDNPENQPKRPGRFVPGSIGDRFNPITDTPYPSGGNTQIGSVPYHPAPGAGASPMGPGGNFILLSRWVRSGGGRLPPGTTVLNDL